MKTNYIWFRDKRTDRHCVLTVVYKPTTFALAVSSVKDNFVKKKGRTIAQNRLLKDEEQPGKVKGVYAVSKTYTSFWPNLRNNIIKSFLEGIYPISPSYVRYLEYRPRPSKTSGGKR